VEVAVTFLFDFHSTARFFILVMINKHMQMMVSMLSSTISAHFS